MLGGCGWVIGSAWPGCGGGGATGGVGAWAAAKVASEEAARNRARRMEDPPETVSRARLAALPRKRNAPTHRRSSKVLAR